jgi:type III secretion protein S
MTETNFIGYLHQGLLLIMLLSMPTIVVASVVGVLFSLFQALTQIQEQTLSFAIKLVAVGVTLALCGRWIGVEIFNDTTLLFDSFAYVGR